RGSGLGRGNKAIVSTEKRCASLRLSRGGCRGTFHIFLHCLWPADVAHHEQIAFGGMTPLFAWEPGKITWIQRRNQVRRHENDKLGFFSLIPHRAEEHAKHRNITQQRCKLLGGGDVLVEQ